MNCNDLQSVIGEMARGALLDAGVRGEAAGHLDECPRCAVRMDDERSLAGGLQALARSADGCAAPPKVEAALLNAFREQPVSSNRSRWIRAGAIAAVAAAIVAAFALRVESPRAREIAVAPAKVVEQVAPVERQAVDPPPPVKRRRQRIRPAMPPAAEATQPTPIMTEFLAVSRPDGWTPQEGGRLVRVQLPQSALGVFGLPVIEDRRSERVQADVMLSDDGLVRAIRFVK